MHITLDTTGSLLQTADGDQNLKQAHEIICPDQTVFSFPVRGRADSLKFVILAALIRFHITDVVKIKQREGSKERIYFNCSYLPRLCSDFATTMLFCFYHPISHPNMGLDILLRIRGWFQFFPERCHKDTKGSNIIIPAPPPDVLGDKGVR